MVSDTTKAYLAGLIDGEGYIGILKTKKGNKKVWKSNFEFTFTPVIKVAMIEKDLITWLYKTFGGTFETRKARKGARESYCWMARKAKVGEFLRMIYPYLMVKKDQADIILSFPRNKTGIPLTEEIYHKRIELYNKLIDKHHQGCSLRD